MPTKTKLDEELKLIPETDKITGKVTYTSELERKLKKRTGFGIEELCRSGRITNAYGRSAPTPPDTLTDEKERAKFYHDYVAEILNGNGLLFYEDPNNTEPKMMKYDKRQKAVTLSNKTVKPKKVKRPGWWNRRKDKKLLAQGKKGTPEMERYREALSREEEAKNARKDHAEHFSEIVSKKDSLGKLKENSDFALDFYLKFNEEEYSSNPFTDPFSREMLVNEIGNRLFMDTYEAMLKKDPARAEQMYHQLVGAQADIENDPKGMLKLLNEKELKFVNSRIEEIRDPKALQDFLQNGGKDRMREDFELFRQVSDKTISKPDLQFADAKKSKDGVMVPDEKTTEAYKKICDDARGALDRLKSIGTTTSGTIPEQLIPQVKHDIAILSFQNTIAHSFGLSQQRKEISKEILNTLDQKSAGSETTNYEKILKGYEDNYMGSLKFDGLKGPDLQKFLAQKGEEKVSKNALFFGIVPKPAAKKAAPAPAKDKSLEKTGEQKKIDYVMI